MSMKWHIQINHCGKMYFRQWQHYDYLVMFRESLGQNYFCITRKRKRKRKTMLTSCPHMDWYALLLYNNHTCHLSAFFSQPNSCRCRRTIFGPDLMPHRKGCAKLCAEHWHWTTWKSWGSYHLIMIIIWLSSYEHKFKDTGLIQVII